MKKRAQAALEFLITRGWVILIILVVVGALVFGVLSPDMFFPERCILPAGITCLDHKVSPPRVVLSLQNNLGYSLTIDNIVINKTDANDQNGASCSITEPVTLQNNEKKAIAITDCNNGDVETRFDGDINLIYTQEGMLPHLMKGDIKTRVKVACFDEQECGTSEFLGDYSCDGDYISKSYKKYTCENAGASKADCGVFDSSIKLNYCNPALGLNCVDGQSSCKSTAVACYSNQDCGTDDYVGSYYCSNKWVARDYRAYTCENAGTVDAKCVFSDSTEQEKYCNPGLNQYCVNGQNTCKILSESCSSKQDCGTDGFEGGYFCNNDYASRTYRAYTCENSKCVVLDSVIVSDNCTRASNLECVNGQSSCQATAIACFSGQDCGTDGFMGDYYCGGDYILKDYKSHTCESAGSVNAKCIASSSAVKSNYCDPALYQFCVNDEVNCRETLMPCSKNTDCGTNDYVGSYYCSDKWVVRDYRAYTCENPGTDNARCIASDSPEQQAYCDPASNKICVDGQSSCQQIVCSSNHDCGTDGFMGDYYCNNNYVSRTYRAYTCENPGTDNARCAAFDSIAMSSYCNAALFSICAEGYSSCQQTACFQKTDCGTDGSLGPYYCSSNKVTQDTLIFTCSDPGTMQAACSSANTPMLIADCNPNKYCVDSYKKCGILTAFTDTFMDASQIDVAASSNISPGGEEAKLSILTGQATQTSDTDFSSGTKDDVRVSGNGDSSNVILALSLGSPVAWKPLSIVTGSWAFALGRDSTRNVLYAGIDSKIMICPASSGCSYIGDWITAYTASAGRVYDFTHDSNHGIMYASYAYYPGKIYRCDTSSGCDSQDDWSVSLTTSESGITSMAFDTINSIVYAGSSGNGLIYRCNTNSNCDSSSDWTVSHDATETFEMTRDDILIDQSRGVMYATSGWNLYRCALSTGCDGQGDWTGYVTPWAAINGLALDTVNGVLYGYEYYTIGMTIIRCNTATNCDAVGDWTVAYYPNPGWAAGWPASQVGLMDSMAFDNINRIMYAGLSSKGTLYDGSNSKIFSCPVSNGCDATSDWSLAYTLPQSTSTYIKAMLYEPQNNRMFASTALDALIYLTIPPYASAGTFVSSPIDAGQNSIFTTLGFSANVPAGTSIKFQLRSAATQAGLASAIWYGPTGTGDYYTSNGQSINPLHTGHRWIQYKAFLATTDTSKTPALESVTVNWQYYPSNGMLFSIAIPSDTTSYLAGKQLLWTENEPVNTNIIYQIEYNKNSQWLLVPDSILPGNSAGLSSQPVGLTRINASYVPIRIKGTLTSNNLNTPVIKDWTVEYYLS